MSKVDKKIKEQRKYIHKVLNNMKIDNEDEFMSAVANVIFEDNRKLKQLETKEQKVIDKLEELKKEYKEALENNSTKAFILKCQIEILEEIMKGEEK